MTQAHLAWSNFYIVDLEYFVTASRRYTGDIDNSTVAIFDIPLPITLKLRQIKM